MSHLLCLQLQPRRHHMSWHSSLWRHLETFDLSFDHFYTFLTKFHHDYLLLHHANVLSAFTFWTQVLLLHYSYSSAPSLHTTFTSSGSDNVWRHRAPWHVTGSHEFSKCRQDTGDMAISETNVWHVTCLEDMLQTFSAKLLVHIYRCKVQNGVCWRLNMTHFCHPCTFL
jgi:hypothetical protein